MSQPVERAVMFAVQQTFPQAKPRPDGQRVIEVQFNPATLTYSVQLQNNSNGTAGDRKGGTQHVSSTSAKLEFDLQFDSTHSGEDVRRQTDIIRRFLQPADETSKAPPQVGFWWGSFHFHGVLDGFRETLDYFSVDGVPLRSSVHVGLTAQDEVFAKVDFGQSAGAGASDVRLLDAQRIGSTPGGRDVASANGIENLRNPEAAVVAAGAGVQLKGAVGLSASAGMGFGGGVGLGVDGGVGTSVGASLGAGGAAGVAGFARLSSERPRVSAALDAKSLQAAVTTPSLSAEFGLGGEAIGSASPGLTTDVGRHARIRFDS
jgi:hypothetical protein